MGINGALGRKLRMGLVGGGRGGFIGNVHRMAATLDHRAILVAGALSSDPAAARAAGVDFGLPESQAYTNFEQMLETEAMRPQGERIDFVTIATPNDTHFAIARRAAELGFDVVCDKPLTLDLAQAEELAAIVSRTGVVLALTHNYTGYPMVRQGRDMIRRGDLGVIEAVRVSYLQGSARRALAPGESRRAPWRDDPARAGAAGCFGDIGVHAYNLLRFMTDMVPLRVSCHLRNFLPDRGPLDDYGHAVIEFEGTGIATLAASKVSHGSENDLQIDIDGTDGSLRWRQEDPNHLLFRRTGHPTQIYTRDPRSPLTSEAHRESCRLPSGHPEGFLEAFANIYTAAFDAMIARRTGQSPPAGPPLYPTVTDGVDGMQFIAQCVASSNEQGAWKEMGHFLVRRSARQPWRRVTSGTSAAPGGEG